MTDHSVRPAQGFVFIKPGEFGEQGLASGTVLDVGLDIDSCEVGSEIIYRPKPTDINYLGRLVIKHENIIERVSYEH